MLLYFLMTIVATSINFLPFEQFEREFLLESTSTEKLHPITETLSQTMHRDLIEGLLLLTKVDEEVTEGFSHFMKDIPSLASDFSRRLSLGGRIFLIGSGSSGRVAIDIGAKANHPQIEGLIAGGASAMFRAKEGFEDSEKDGQEALRDKNISPNDVIILISASGSASFNVGCGHFAADLGAKVVYFYNSLEIPARTKGLFTRALNPVIPLLIDIGPQAISGSTRLQGATLAEASLGALIGTTLYRYQGNEEGANAYPKLIFEGMQEIAHLLKDKKLLNAIGSLGQQEADVFLHPDSNFRRIRDETERGYVTLVAKGDSIREVVIDAVETSPTFSTNPVRREKESLKKRAEFRAYLMNVKDNTTAWQQLLGNSPQERDTEQFLLGKDVIKGINTYANQPKGKGNLVIGVAKIKSEETLPFDLLDTLSEVIQNQGKGHLILLSWKSLSEEEKSHLIKRQIPFILVENIPHDPFGLLETLLLKQILNLRSNTAMILSNKVYGNLMIDVRAANKKLIGRCLRLSQLIWSTLRPESPPPSLCELYHLVEDLSEKMEEWQRADLYTPTLIKILLTMLAEKKSPQEFPSILDKLYEEKESIEWIRL